MYYYTHIVIKTPNSLEDSLIALDILLYQLTVNL